MGFSRQEYCSGLPFPSPVDRILSDLSTMTRPSWVAPHGMAQFHWVRQDCGPVIRLASFLWLWFQSVCPLMPSRNTCGLTWVSLTLAMGYHFTAAPAKHSRCSLPCTRGIFSRPLLLTLNVEELLSALLRPAAAALWRWGCSSRPPALTSEVGKLLCAAPALSQPGALGHHPWPWARGSSSWPHFCVVPNHNSWIPSGFQCTIFTWQENVFPINYFEYFAKECSCQFALLIQCMRCFKECSIWLVSQLWPTLCDLMGSSPKGSSVHGDSPGKNTGVGCQALLQGIFPTQGSNPVLPHFRWILYWLSYLGNPRTLEWVDYPFSRRSSQPRNWTGVSYVAGRFFSSWGTREAHVSNPKKLEESRNRFFLRCSRKSTTYWQFDVSAILCVLDFLS